MKIAIPTEYPGGLEAKISNHFGECDVFTVVEIDPKQTDFKNTKVILIKSRNHLNCGALLLRLRKAGTNVIIVKKIGSNALEIIELEKIPIYAADGTVLQVLDKFRSNQLDQISKANICLGKEHEPPSSNS